MLATARIALSSLFLLLAPFATGSQSAMAGPALLFEAESGKLLYGEDIDDQWHPASLTKIMTAYLTFEAIKTGKLTLETKIPYSEAAALMPASKIGMPVGAELMVDVALRALIIKSANDIAVVLAEAISGSEAQFAEKMTSTAQRLGMSRTRFVNANGLPAPEQVTTARDLAKLSRAIVREYPQYNHYWSMSDMRIGRIRIATHNALLKTYVGADGLKTGFICDSGYNVVASATREGTRMVAVVLGENSGHERSIRAQALLEHGFNSWGWKTAFDTETLESAKASADAKDVASIRASVVATECGNRRRIVRVADARQREKKRAAAALAGKPAEAGAKGGTAVAGSPGAPAGTPASGGVVQNKPKPKPKPKSEAASAPATPGAPSATVR